MTGTLIMDYFFSLTGQKGVSYPNIVIIRLLGYQVTGAV